MPTFTNNVPGNANAIEGVADAGTGVAGISDSGIGLFGESKKNEGVRGVSRSAHAGVVGINRSPAPRLAPISHGDPEATSGGNGGWFESSQGEGVRGWSKTRHHGGVVGVNTDGGVGVFGTSDTGVGVWGTSIDYEGIHAETKSTRTAAMAAYQKNPQSDTAALYVKHDGNRTAAVFVGNIVVTGEIRLANAADCAEDFDISAGSAAEPGTVMALNDEGALQESFRPYDKRVAGVISGAGTYKPGLILDKHETQSDRRPIALLGKVFCKVDAQFGAIEVGDLLTSSPSPGHAMKASDPLKAFGAVIGKALSQLKEGQGLIPILIALQ